MYSSSRSGKKRKYRDRGPQQNRRREQENDQGWNYNKGLSVSSDVEEEIHDPLRALHIEAHEANILRGPQAEAAAESLEVVVCYEVTKDGDSSCSTPMRQTKSRVKDSQDMTRTGATAVLVKLRSGVELQQSNSRSGTTEGQRHAREDVKLSIVDMDADAGTSLHTTGSLHDGNPDSETIWVDRYDIRLLFDSLPSIPHPISDPLTAATSTVRASSPSGWSDLSSDAEDTFFFTTEETEDFRRDKRRRLIEQAREERLRQRLEEDGDDDAKNNDPSDSWGGSDEEPDESQSLLMTRTAKHLAGSPNPAQLEMRILANHGADPRFAFLLPRGRWRRAWVAAKDRVIREKEKEAAEKDKKATLGGLAGYGSGSGSDSDDEGNMQETDGATNELGSEGPQPPDMSPAPLPPAPPPTVPPPPPPLPTSITNVEPDTDSAIKAARRQRAKEWAERRRALNDNSREVAE